MVKVKVIFLDFDGVLHATVGKGASMREFVWLPILKDLISTRDDCKIVIHSSYRRTHKPEYLRERLGLGKDVFLGVTLPTLERWASIQDWLRRNRSWVESFRILDDQAFEFPNPAPAELILCDGRKGLSEERVQRELHAWLHADSGVQ